jgi:hypothetical protein
MLLVPMSFAAALEMNRFSLGLGVEGSVNTRKGMSLGGILSAGYEIMPNLTVGTGFGASHDFDRIVTLTPEVFVRWYFFTLKTMPLFVQADLGTSIIFEDAKVHPAFMGGLAAGIRIPLKNWYAEPFLRAGYPFIWSSGIIAGYRF